MQLVTEFSGYITEILQVDKKRDLNYMCSLNKFINYIEKLISVYFSIAKSFKPSDLFFFILNQV